MTIDMDGAQPHAAFPLRIAPTRRFLLDRDESPFLLQGDSPWSLFVVPTEEEVLAYLDLRAGQGFNALVSDLIERLLAHDPPRNAYREDPFGGGSDLARPNDAYFDRAERLIRAAGERGFLMLLNPLYLGYRSPGIELFRRREEGWYREAIENGPSACRDYGQWLGARFRDVPNILWVLSGDRCPGEALPHVRGLAAGLLEADRPDRLLTAHVHPGCRPVESYPADPWLTVNQVYSYEIVHRACRTEYEHLPVMPYFMFESSYEGMHNASRHQLRRQAYWPMLFGAFGQCMGNDPAFWFGPGWEAALDSPAARAMAHWRAVFAGRRWWDLVPDVDHHLLVGGRGESNGLDLAAAASTPDGGLAIAYIPDAREIVLDLGTLATAGTLRFTWVDPASGVTTDATAHRARGTHRLRSPFAEDAVLIAEAAT